MAKTAHLVGIHIDFVPVFAPGDMPPSNNGYNDWYAWAEVQYKAGLRQKKCNLCHRYYFPQEISNHNCEVS